MIFFVYVFLPSYVYADDTCCLGLGGDNYCDFSTHQLYCKNGQASTQCTCQKAPTATPIPTTMPTDTPAIVPTLVCPAYASFSEKSNACTCNSGYVVSNNTCVTYKEYCQAQYGNNAVVDSGSNACGCSGGYTLNTNATECVTMDGLCSEKLGNKSYYNSTNNQCYCYDGYAIQNGLCQVMPTQTATNAPTTGVRLVPNTPAPMPTLAGVIIPTRAPTKPPDKKPVTFNINKKVPGLHGYIAVKKKNVGLFETIINAILQALIKAFNI